MHKQYGNVVLVTGASSGIGKSVAEFLMNKGYRVYGTSRKEQSEDNIIRSGDGGGFLRMLQLDVCSEDSVKDAIDLIFKSEGTVDIVVNNAGMGIAGSVEDTSSEEAQMQFDTNFFGMHRVCRHVVPIMRKQGKGIIVNISSIAAVFPIPYQSMYIASKAAIEAMSGVLRNEVKPFGIKVALIEPGDTKTGFTDSRVFVAAAGENSAYNGTFRDSVNVMVRDETNGPDPVVVAKEIYRIICRKDPPIRVVVGMKYKVLVFLKRLLPAKFTAYVISKMY